MNDSQELGQDPIPSSDWTKVYMVRRDSIHPSPENNLVYKPTDPSDPNLVLLSEDMSENGILEPIVVTQDMRILSGHRRFAASGLAGFGEVPVRIYPIDSSSPGFVQLLASFNKQRVKTLDEFLREAILSTSKEDAYEELLEFREEESYIDADSLCSIDIRASKSRAKISKAKTPFLAAITKVINENREYWPLSDRQIHYMLLNAPPLIHASKPDSTYKNTKQSYKALVDLLTRARLTSQIPWRAIADPTRPITITNAFNNPQDFINQEVPRFLKGYWRSLSQSQPNHIEVVGEKNTIAGIIDPIAKKYHVPCTIGRGFCSITPRKEMADRYRRSGRGKLILLVLSDFDPDGEEIAHSFARSLRDDFGVQDIEPIKVAITSEQIAEFGLVPIMSAKECSTNYNRFVDRHGEDVFELEAIRPAQLQELLNDAIKAVMDMNMYNAELDAEKNDAQLLSGVRETVFEAIKDIDFRNLNGMN
jgi:hypothetical protein